MKYEEEILCLVWLLMIFGVGSKRIWALLRLYHTPQGVINALYTGPKLKVHHLTERNQRRIEEIQISHVREMLARIQANHQSVVWYGDPAYPSILFTIEDPPVLLFYQGDLDLLQRRLLLTIVGTRTPSQYSLRVEKRLCHELVHQNFVLLTGFAVGADIAANLCALEQGRPSIAVMGCGLDVPYPRQNVPLKEKIAENGLLLSEFLPGTEPKPSNFPIRNRILSGLTMGTLVVQAPENSGALITADYALEQGRMLFCVPPADIFDKRYVGVLEYFQNGASVAASGWDILRAYEVRCAGGQWRATLPKNLIIGGIPAPLPEVSKIGEEEDPATEPKHTAQSQPDPPMQTELSPALLAQSAAAPIESEDQQPDPAPAPPATKPALSPNIQKPLDQLAKDMLHLLQQHEDMDVDQISMEMDLPVRDLISSLIELELYGKVQRMPGKRYRAV